MKLKPNGFVAKCQCGMYVGALDYKCTDKKEAGKVIGAWLHDGCTVEPRFDSTWHVSINPCNCEATS